MTVSSYQDFMLPTLKLIADNCEHKSRDIVEQAQICLVCQKLINRKITKPKTLSSEHFKQIEKEIFRIEY